MRIWRQTRGLSDDRSLTDNRSLSFTIFSGDPFETLFVDTEHSVYTLLNGKDASQFVLVDSVLSLAPKNFNAPTDMNADNVYIAPMRSMDPTSGGFRIFTVAVTVSDLVVGDAVSYILPTAQGNGDGSSWENAGHIRDLNDFIAAVGPGGTIYLGNHAGPYTLGVLNVTLSHGGAKLAPVTVMCVDAALVSGAATFVGYRTAWISPADPDQTTSVVGWTIGSTVFTLSFGANYLTFDGFIFENIGAAFSLEANIRGVTLQNYKFLNVRRFVEMAKGLLVSDIIIRDGKGVGYSKQSIRVRGYSHDWLIEDVSHDSRRQIGDAFAVGVQFSERAHDINCRRATMANSHDQARKFWNGDGFSSESGNYNLTFEDCTARGCTDAGFDLKGAAGTTFVLTNCISEDNKNNFKLWGVHIGQSPNFVIRGGRSNEPKRRGGTGAPTHFDLTRYADALIGQGLAITDTDASGAIYRSEDEPCIFRIEASVTEVSLKARTVLFAGSRFLDGL